jgi:tRNA threonylcarbamoyl adenosine modification protein YeaZ
MELAIDTSSDMAGVALAEQGRLVTELIWRTTANHTVELIPTIGELLLRVKLGFKDISGISVALGPGSFNGLRVGVSAAKGLAAALNVPLAGISTLEVEAWPYGFLGMPVCPVHDAGRGELAVALFSGSDGVWKRLLDDRLLKAEELIASINQPTVFCGELPEKVEELLLSSLGVLAAVPPRAARSRIMACLAWLGWQRMEKYPDNPSALQPVYLRQPNITKPKKDYVP